MNQPVPVFVGRIDDPGKIVVFDRAPFDRWLKSLVGQRVSVIVKKYRKQRSSQQNRYYWGVVVALLADHCGYAPDEMHEVLTLRFLRLEDCPFTGQPRRRRTPDTNTSEFAEFVNRCLELGAELGLNIPSPDGVELASD